MGNIKTEKKVMIQEIGGWFYAAKLLKEQELENSGGNQYKLLCWLKKNSSNAFHGDIIKKNSTVLIPKEHIDYLKLLTFKITINDKNEIEISEHYCLNFTPSVQVFRSAYEKRQSKIKGTEYMKNWSKTAHDMVYGDENDKKILSYSENFDDTISDSKTSKVDISGCPENKLIINMREFLLSRASKSKVMQKELLELVNFFEKAKKDDAEYTFSDKAIEQIKGNQCVKDYMCEMKRLIINELKRVNWDLSEFEKEDSESVQKIREQVQNTVKYPKFNDREDGLMIALHDLQGTNVYIENAKIEDDVFSGTLQFNFFDHFGLDDQDIMNEGKVLGIFTVKYSSLEGFRSWYYLQHSDKYNTSDNTVERQYKPFVTNFSIDDKIKEDI